MLYFEGSLGRARGEATLTDIGPKVATRDFVQIMCFIEDHVIMAGDKLGVSSVTASRENRKIEMVIDDNRSAFCASCRLRVTQHRSLTTSA